MMTAAVVAIICFAYFVQAAFGFGAGLIALPLLGLLIDTKTAVVLLAIFPTLTAVLLIPLRSAIDWGLIRKLIPGVLAGLAAGLILFAYADVKIISYALAAYLLMYVANEYVPLKFFRATGARIPKKSSRTPSVSAAASCKASWEPAVR